MRGVCKARRAAFLAPLARDYVRIQINARRHDHGFCKIGIAQSRFDAAHRTVFREYFRRFRLQYIQVLLLFQSALHGQVVLYLVRLRAQRMYRLALAAVEHTHLQIGGVCVDAHLSAQSVYLAHEVPLRRAAYRRIARHIRYRVGRQRHHQRAQGCARQSKRRFNARMASAYDYRIVTLIHSNYYNILIN